MSAATQVCELTGLDAAAKHIELLTGLPDTEIHVRLIHDFDKENKPTQKLFGRLNVLWPEIEAAQLQGYGVFLVVNDGGNTDAEITRVRALFLDADDVPLTNIRWHISPDFIVQRDGTHWHAYWRVLFMPVEQFKSAQKHLAAHYGTDPAVCNPSRVMRLAGTLHQKVTKQ